MRCRPHLQRPTLLEPEAVRRMPHLGQWLSGRQLRRRMNGAEAGGPHSILLLLPPRPRAPVVPPMNAPTLDRWVLFCAGVALLAPAAATAEPDTFGLGNGHSGALTVSTNGAIVNTYAQVTAAVA